MSLILSGTDGLSEVDGTAATPAIRGTDANTGIFFGTDIIGFSEGGVEAMRIDASGNLLVGTATQATGALLTVNGSIKGTITSGTAVASTSGTSIDFTGIPSWVKRLTVVIKGVSTNGTSNPVIQIGSGSVTTTGYLTSTWQANTTNANNTNGFVIRGTTTAALVQSGNLIINLLGSNIYVATGIFSQTGGADSVIVGGDITLSGALDRVRLTTVNGTDTFDAGSINILYEG